MKPSKLNTFLFLTLSPAFAFCQSGFNADQKEIYRTIVLISNAWAQNNLDTLEKYVNADYVHTDVRGQFLSRAKWFDYVKEKKQNGIVNAEVGFDDVHIDIVGDFAFVTGINTISGAAYAGKDNNTKQRSLRFTQIMQRNGNIWKRKMFQATYIDSL